MRHVWLRRLFYLSLLMLMVPVYMLYRQLQPVTTTAAENTLLLDQVVGQWHVALHGQSLSRAGTPESNEYQLHICAECTRTLKAAFISIGKPIAAEYGAVFSGGPIVFRSELPVPAEPRAEVKIWLTLEGWNGDVWQVSIAPLFSAGDSPP